MRAVTPREIQRITLAQINRDLARARDNLRAHRQVCWTCRRAGDNYALCCDAGWRLAKQDARARSARRRWDENESRGQGVLF